MRFCRVSPRCSASTYDGRYLPMALESIISGRGGSEAIPGKILDIIAYDEREKTHCLEDLSAFLMSDRSYNETAEILGVHRNTAKYRTERIAEIFEIDYSDPEMMFTLQLGTRLVAYLRERGAFEHFMEHGSGESGKS